MFSTLLEVENPDLRNIWIIGKVTANNDPEKLQRIKVEVPGLYEPESPWCWAKQMSLFAGGQGAGFGTFGVPEVGSYVALELQDGDPHHPVYVCTVLLEGNQIPEAGVNYPHRYGFKDSQGNLFYIDKNTGVVKFTHNTGTDIQIDGNGDVTITAAGKTVTVTAATINANASGNLSATAGGTATLSGTTVNVTASGQLTLSASNLSFNVTGTSTFTGGGTVNLP